MNDSSSSANPMRWAVEHSDAPGTSPALEQELDALYQAHAESLLRYAMNATADLDFARESVQEVFLRYAEYRQCDDPPPAALVWLLRELRGLMASNARQREHQTLTGLPRFPETGAAPSPEAEALINEARRWIDQLTAPGELECFLLRREGLSYREIAAIMEISIGTVGATLARAVRKLELTLEREKDPAP